MFAVGHEKPDAKGRYDHLFRLWLYILPKLCIINNHMQMEKRPHIDFLCQQLTTRSMYVKIMRRACENM